MASYQVEVTHSAVKDLRRIDRTWIPKICQAIEKLGSETRPNGCKKLEGADRTYRVRVSDYRIVYEILDEKLIILVVRIRHRSDVYR